MGFISKVELKKQLQAMGIKVEGNYVKKSDIYKVIADNKLDYTVDVGMFDHAGSGKAEWESFKTATGVLTEISAKELQKFVDNYFPILLKKTEADKKSCVVHTEGNELNFTYTSQNKKRDLYAEIVVLFKKEGKEIDIENMFKKAISDFKKSNQIR